MVCYFPCFQPFPNIVSLSSHSTIYETQQNIEQDYKHLAVTCNIEVTQNSLDLIQNCDFYFPYLTFIARLAYRVCDPCPLLLSQLVGYLVSLLTSFGCFWLPSVNAFECLSSIIAISDASMLVLLVIFSVIQTTEVELLSLLSGSCLRNKRNDSETIKFRLTYQNVLNTCMNTMSKMGSHIELPSKILRLQFPVRDFMQHAKYVVESYNLLEYSFL